jgi:hypothetical protein
MMELSISELKPSRHLDLDKAELLLEKSSDIHKIETINWLSFPYKPEVKFKIAYCQNQILIKFYVSEESIRASETRINGDVYKDSCVEFFISPKGDGLYYNFEFSCIGIPHLGYGQSRNNRILINPEIANKIETRSSLGDLPFDDKTGGYQWNMLVLIPVSTMIYDRGLQLKGMKAGANFYKCGDETSSPHFVTWNPVNSDKPDFHQTESFGRLSFE